jgi:hypothetical protein
VFAEVHMWTGLSVIKEDGTPTATSDEVLGAVSTVTLRSVRIRTPIPQPNDAAGRHRIYAESLMACLADWGWQSSPVACQREALRIAPSRPYRGSVRIRTGTQACN